MRDLIFIHFMLGPNKTPIGGSRGIQIKTMNSYDAFVNSGETADAFVIDAEGVLSRGRQLLLALRKDPYSALAPIYLAQSLGVTFDAASDGVITDVAHVENAVNEMIRYAADLNETSMRESHDYRLLGYMYMRRDRQLTPIGDPLSPEVYTYPAAEALAEDDTPVDVWLKNMLDRGLIERGALVDRVRYCPKCEWSHLNYVDVCPLCKSIDISEHPFLHCFTCGRVAAQEEFMVGGGLQCPNCLAKLRHIGSDYDRPLESFVCASCNQSFAEPNVSVHCLKCHEKLTPDVLGVRTLYSMTLTERGRVSARTGSLEDIYAILDNLNFINPKYYTQLLDWLLLLSQRYPEDPFSMIGIFFENITELTDAYGRHRVSELLDGFAGRLRQQVRTTDITTRTSRSHFWMLLPKTPYQGCRILASRIAELGNLTQQSDGSRLRYKIVTFSAPEDVVKGESGELLLARLANMAM